MHKTKVSRAITGLERRNWITRTTDTRDRRIEQVKLTPEGRRRYKELVTIAQHFERSLIERLGDDQSLELPSTSHMSIVDSYGNAVSLTTTIENAFGARLMVRGFLLNNELTDFSFATHNNGVPIANRVAPGKRPRSSMSPTIALKDGAPAIIVGSPGGSRIIGYVVNALINHIDWGMEPAQAVAMPHLVNRFGTFDLEAGTMAEELAGDLAALGFAVNIRNLNSGLHMIAIDRDGDNVGLSGGADPRREGIVAGQ